MCSFANRFVFALGGYLSDEVIRIDLATDSWLFMPELENGSFTTSCCTLGNALYVY